jgi:gamma-glutamylcyclotransferase (GGCT)/AIG2-like uncharacterized protein YtfP
MKKHIIYVYGTLRTGGNDIHMVPGRLYYVGGYPGLKLLTPECGSFVKAERVVVSEERLKQLDSYEGYRENSPQSSLFVRRPYLDGWIYEFNHDTSRMPLISSGDFLEYKGQTRGRAASMVESDSDKLEETYA